MHGKDEISNGLLARIVQIVKRASRTVPFPKANDDEIIVKEKISLWERFTTFHLVPGSPKLALWDSLVVLVGCINGFIIPWSVAFYTLTPAVLIIQYLIDIFYLCDMYVRFHVAYIERGFIVVFPKEMATKYLKSNEFKFDLVSNLPWDILALVAVGSPDGLYFLGVCRLVKILRTMKLAWWFNSQEKRLNSATGMQMVKFAIYISLVQHWAACIWYAIACPMTRCQPLSWVNDMNLQNATRDEQYVASLYWSVMSMTTTGYGDIHAVNDGEQIFSILCMITGVFLFGYVSGTIASILSNLDSRRVAYRQKVEAIRQYMTDQDMNKNVQKRVTDWYEYTWDRNKGIDVKNVFNDLPTSFRAEVALTLNQQAINKTSIFDGTSTGFKRILALCMTVNYFTANTYIVHKNEMSKEMFFVIQGRVDMLNDDETKSIHSLIEGSHFGEYSLILGHLAEATMMAISNCDVYVLSKSSFDHARASYPEDLEIVHQNTQKQYEKWVEQRDAKKRRVGGAADKSGVDDDDDDDDYLESNTPAVEEAPQEVIVESPPRESKNQGRRWSLTNPFDSSGSSSQTANRRASIASTTGVEMSSDRRGSTDSAVKAGFLQATKEEAALIKASHSRRKSSTSGMLKASYESKLPQAKRKDEEAKK